MCLSLAAWLNHQKKANPRRRQPPQLCKDSPRGNSEQEPFRLLDLPGRVLHLVAVNVSNPRDLQALLRTCTSLLPLADDEMLQQDWLLHNRRDLALAQAVRQSRISLVGRLLESGQVDARRHAVCGCYTIMRQVCYVGNGDMARTLLRHDPGLASVRDSDGLTPLHYAAYLGRPNIAALLLATPGVDCNARCNNGCTPLHFACSYGHLEVVQQLLAVQGIDVNATGNKEQTPLLVACLNLGNASVSDAIIAALLAAPNVDVNCEGGDGHAPLHAAVASGRTSVVRMLLEHSRMDVGRPGGRPLELATALHLAETEEAAEALLAAGASLEARDFHQRTPLHYACKYANPGAAMAMIKAGADVNAVSDIGWTPLGYALVSLKEDGSKQGVAEVVEALKARGALP